MSTSVSIIIVTCSRLDSLRETLASLCNIRIPDDFRVEVLLVENGSHSGIEQLLPTLSQDEFVIRYFFVEAAGKAHSLNLAVAEATGDILLFTDDDVRLPREWLVDMCMPLVRGEGAVVVGGCRLAPHLSRDWMTPFHRSFLASTEYLSDTDPSEFAGINVACLREVFSKVPEFDCVLGGKGPPKGEDALFARQLRIAGYVFVSRTNVQVEHHFLESRLSYQSWLRAAVSSGKSVAYIMHHWDHQGIPFVRLQLFCVTLKLRLRLLFQSDGSPEREGITPWELSYRQEIAVFEYFISERRRPRHYSLRGLRRLNSTRSRIAV
jgi:glycosyltransferase involved in cell wall biosynthesis